MRILLIHNPKAGDRKHSKKQLMASLTRCGHQAFYQSTKKHGWKKALDYPARPGKMSIDGKDISHRYILWGAMNIRSAGPALHLAPKAKTDDGRLDFVAVREHERQVFIKHVDAHLAGRKERAPLSPRKFRELKITSPPGAM